MIAVKQASAGCEPAHRASPERELALRELAARERELAARELAARETLKSQIARLEREISSVVAAAFPHVRPLERQERRPGGCPAELAPRLLGLAELERLRDELAGRLQRARAQAEERVALAERSRALLEEMRRVPERHKLVRLKVSDLGEGGCGVWEVRPRLGPIGMLAGWWQVKLSSGCP